MSPSRKVLAAAVAVAGATALTVAGANANGADGRSPRAQAASYGGVRVPIAEAPWMASILPLDARLRAAKAPPGHALRCSAAVIGPRLVLTAAHCVGRFDMAHQGVRVGTDDPVQRRGRVVPIARVWSPQAGRRRLLGNGLDIALIETAKPLGVPALPLAGERPRVGETVSSFGFGRDRASFEGGAPSRLLLRRVDSVVAADCAGAIPDEPPEPICTTTTDGSGARPGDSGGPLVIWRNGAPALAGDLSAGAESGLSLNIFADAIANRSFIAKPPPSRRVPVAVRPIHITGALRPGARAGCDATFSPKPTRVAYAWNFGPLLDRQHTTVYYDAQGQRRRYADTLAPDAEHRTITVPQAAAGERVQCIVTAYRGPFLRVVAVAVRKAPF